MSCPHLLDAESTLKPIFDACTRAIEAQDFDKAVSFYHPDATLVHKGKSCHYGRDAIKQAFVEFAEIGGKSTAKFSNMKWVGVDDGWIVLTSDFETTMEKMGEAKMEGSFLHIWRKEGSDWLIYHEEFSAPEVK